MALFGIKLPKNPLADVKSAQRWLAEFNIHDPIAAHAAFVTEIADIADFEARRTPRALQALFHADSGSRELLALLTSQYIAHASQSSKIEQQIWQALCDLTQGFAKAYAAFARDIAGEARDTKWQELLPELNVRQIKHFGLDAKIRLFRYEQWIPGKWIELHTLYALACSHQFEHQPVILAGVDGATTIEHKYLEVLVLQLANTGNVMPAYVEWLATRLQEWCAHLRLTSEPSTLWSFYVDSTHRGGLRRVGAMRPQGHVLFLDAKPLHSRLRQHVLGIEQRIKTQPLSARTARRVEQVSILTKLLAQLDGEFRPFPRRGERTTSAGKLDAIVGFTMISGYLREDDRALVPELDTGTSFGGTMEIAVFGHIRGDRDRHIAATQRRLTRFSAAGGPWEVKDVSATGFRLVATLDVANPVAPGMLVATRLQGEVTWTLGVVRRMKRLTINRAEIGLQVIADAVVGITLAEQRASAAKDRSIDGESGRRNGRPFGALFLALRRRDQDMVLQSIVVPSVEYHPAKRFCLQTSTSSYSIRCGQLLEQQAGWVWTAIEPLELPADPTSIPAPLYSAL